MSMGDYSVSLLLSVCSCYERIKTSLSYLMTCLKYVCYIIITKCESSCQFVPLCGVACSAALCPWSVMTPPLPCTLQPSDDEVNSNEESEYSDEDSESEYSEDMSDSGGGSDGEVSLPLLEF